VHDDDACAGQKVRDLRNWLTIYSYWNQGGQDNVATMLLYLVDQYLVPTGIAPKPVQETPPTGIFQDTGHLACGGKALRHGKAFIRHC
jgi:cobalamin biosynthesis Mg chelatase CobN